MSKLVLILEGLCCAACALKIEDRSKKIDGVLDASINFSTKTMFISIDDKHNKEEIKSLVIKIVKIVEPNVKVIDKNNFTRGIKKAPINGTLKKANYRNNKIKPTSKVKKNKYLIFLRENSIFFIGIIIYAINLIFKFTFELRLVLYVISYILIGGDVVLKALRNIIKGEIFDENFLMVIATCGAFLIKEFEEAVAVMIFYKVGELFQESAVEKSRKSIEELMNIRPEYANLLSGNSEKMVNPAKVHVGDIILIKPGERIPLDGVVINGESYVDTSALTGESVLRKVEKNSDVLSGAINKSGVLRVRVLKLFSESTVSKILELVQNAGSKKAKTEKFISKFAKYYTPVVVFSALALAVIPPLIIKNATFSEWTYRALVFLVVSCPCALVISIPLGFFGGIGAASRNGILVKGGNYLEILRNVKTVVFDKTGTLTEGTFKVHEIKAYNDFKNEDILKIAATLESYSNHPIAMSIKEEYKGKILKSSIKNFEEISGYGVKGKINDKECIVGNYKFMLMNSIRCIEVKSAATTVYIAANGKYAGYIIIGDQIKKEAKKGINELKKLGVKNIIMLTGDSESISKKVATELNLDKYYSELLPNDKVYKLEEIMKNKNNKDKVMFVGDGINDAPVLARADIGTAMGGVGSDAAIEASDMVIMTDEINKIATSIKIAKKTNRIVTQNIVFALSVKLIILVLGAGGHANMWEAVFGDVGVALIAVLNSVRSLKIKE